MTIIFETKHAEFHKSKKDELQLTVFAFQCLVFPGLAFLGPEI